MVGTAGETAPFPLDEPEVEVARIERAIAEHDARLKDLMLARLHGDAEQAGAVARLRQSAEWAQRQRDAEIANADFLILGSIASGLIVVLLLIAPMVDAWLGKVL